MANVSSNWQDSLDDRLVNRLTRPLHQPGMIKWAMSQGIMNRCDRILNRVPLLSQQMGRWGNNTTVSYDPVPIVYAEPVSSPKQEEMGTGTDNVQMSNQSKNHPSVPIIQRKEDSSQVKSVQKDNKTIDVQNLTDLSSSNFSGETTPSLSLETETNQTSISPSEISVVSPQPISEELANTSEMPLEAKFIDSSTPQFNQNTSSASSQEETKIINQTAISPSERLRVSSQISEDLSNHTSSMPLEAKFIDSSTPQFNQNTSSASSQEETKIINQTAISPSERLRVSSQPIAEDLSNHTSSMPLGQEFTSISEKPLPIIKAKQQNSSLSLSPLSIVNPLNTLVPLKQLQQDNNHSTKINSIKQKNLEPEISSNKFPIVMTQPLTYKVNFAKNETLFARNEPNDQNQSFNISNSQTKSSNSNQKNYPLTTPLISPVRSKLKSQPLPLYVAKKMPLSNSINQQANLSNQNIIGENTSFSSSQKIYANPSLPTQTSVSTMENQANSKIDIDAIANKVERKLMRRLVIESERRGKIR
ncbi:hypothetical protein [Dapis sp. BLCC M229]|uniref:hypothetical protein n=1 Tax=Dapis sp. BLCC M229 TaxID=3400188 RepID=UPI003CF3AE85